MESIHGRWGGLRLSNCLIPAETHGRCAFGKLGCAGGLWPAQRPTGLAPCQSQALGLTIEGTPCREREGRKQERAREHGRRGREWKSVSTSVDVTDKMAQVGPKEGKVSPVVGPLELPLLFTCPGAKDLNACKGPAQPWFRGHPKQL